MNIDAPRVKAFMARLSPLSPEEKQQEYARLKATDPAFFAQVQALAEAVKKHDEMTANMTPEAIAAISRNPRVQHLATTLNQMGSGQLESVLGRLGSRSPTLLEAIRNAMFTFEDLVYADGRGLQDLLAKVDRKVLCYALRTASSEVEEKIFSQMSRRAAELLRDDMEVMGRVRRSEVDEAQRAVTDLARKMMKAGTLIVRKPGDADEWV